MRLENKILLLSFFLGLCSWVTGSLLDNFFYQEGSITRGLNHNWYLLLIFVIFGFICSKLISKIKQKQSELEVSDKILNTAQKMTHIGSWHLDIQEDKLIWSDEAYQIFGLQPQEFGASYDAFLSTIHPDDKELVDKTYKNSINNKTPYEIIHRIVRPDGETRVVHEKSIDITNASGKIVHSYGMVHDITEAKKNEEEKEELICRLQKSLSEIKTLKGILPICMFCKKIRDDKGYWDQVEVYVKMHTEADFSHAVCPECAKKHYPEFVSQKGEL